MKTEYLITFEYEKKLCISPESFKSLLQTHAEIKIEKNKFKFKGKEFKYKLSNGKLSDGSVYYDLTVYIDDIQGDKAEYSELLKEIRTISKTLNTGDFFELHNAISEFYCNKGYNIIYKLEILMRKLIYKFMAISVGTNWKDSSTPKDVINSIKDKKSDSNFLHEVDFIKLSDFLFQKIDKNPEALIKAIKSKNVEESIGIKELVEYLPYTNWEKFFSKKVNCDSFFLKSRWEKLYDLRCKIAHNKNFSERDYNELKELSNEVIEKLESALNSVDEIHIEPEDKNEVAETLSGAKSDNTFEFIKLYNLITKYVREISELCSDENDIYNSTTANKSNFLMQIRYLFNNKGLINKELLVELEGMSKFRNILIHQFGNAELTEQELHAKVLRLKELLKYFNFIYIDNSRLSSLRGIDIKG